MLETLNAINKKVDDANLTLGDFASNKNKISCENSDLLRIVGDLDNNLNILAQQKAPLPPSSTTSRLCATMRLARGVCSLANTGTWSTSLTEPAVLSRRKLLAVRTA